MSLFSVSSSDNLTQKQYRFLQDKPPTVFCDMCTRTELYDNSYEPNYGYLDCVVTVYAFILIFSC